MTSKDYPLVVIAGPTATGKSDLSLFLAKQIEGEIVNFDAMQVYKDLNIGTAKIDEKIRKKLTHHIIDVAEVDEFFSAGKFMELSRDSLEKIKARKKIPILVGGTGFYLRALLKGIFQGPGRNDNLRKRFEKIKKNHGNETLYRILARKDPKSAARISPNDHQRVTRALEIYYLTGMPMSDHFGKNERPLTGYRYKMFGLKLPRDELYDRINQRVLRMIRAGWIDEVKNLLEKGISPHSKGMEAIGYKEIVKVVQGEIDLEEAITMIQRSTRRYAKRQMTWFRKIKEIDWIEGCGSNLEVQKIVLAKTREFLSSLSDTDTQV